MVLDRSGEPEITIQLTSSQYERGRKILHVTPRAFFVKRTPPDTSVYTKANAKRTRSFSHTFGYVSMHTPLVIRVAPFNGE